MKFAAQCTQQVGVKQSPDPELPRQNHKRIFAPGAPPTPRHKAFGPQSVLASWDWAAQETIQS